MEILPLTQGSKAASLKYIISSFTYILPFNLGLCCMVLTQSLQMPTRPFVFLWNMRAFWFCPRKAVFSYVFTACVAPSEKADYFSACSAKVCCYHFACIHLLSNIWNISFVSSLPWCQVLVPRTLQPWFKCLYEELSSHTLEYISY